MLGEVRDESTVVGQSCLVGEVDEASSLTTCLA
jgi:hypothetical protein